MVAASSGSALNSSAFRLSWPGAFPFFRELMAWIISLLVGTSLLMSRSVAASWMFGTTVSGGLFKSSLKCSVQRRCYSPSDVNKIPFLSFTSTLVVWHLPVMILVTIYTVPCSLRAAASSAWDTRFSMYFHLSALVRRSVHLFVRCPIHLLMSFFKPLGFRVHNFLL